MRTKLHIYKLEKLPMGGRNCKDVDLWEKRAEGVVGVGRIPNGEMVERRVEK